MFNRKALVLWKSAKQHQSLAIGRALRYSTLNHTDWENIQNSSIDGFSFQNNKTQYCLALLSEGLGEAQARRFLAKCGLMAPSRSAFYDEQNNNLAFISIDKKLSKNLLLL